MRLISFPLCALALASLVLAIPVRRSFLLLPSLLHDWMTHFLVDRSARGQAERDLDPRSRLAPLIGSRIQTIRSESNNLLDTPQGKTDITVGGLKLTGLCSDDRC